MGHPLWAEGRGGCEAWECRGRRSLPWTGGRGSAGPKHVPRVVGLQAPGPTGHVSRAREPQCRSEGRRQLPRAPERRGDS